MPKEFGPVTRETYKTQTFDSWEINSAKKLQTKTENLFPNDKPPVNGDLFTRFPTLQSRGNSTIFKPMAEQSVTELTQSTEKEAPQTSGNADPKPATRHNQETHRTVAKREDGEAKKTVDKPEKDYSRTEEEILAQQQEDAKTLDELLAELTEEGEIIPTMNHDELETALGERLTNERSGSMKHVYDVEGRSDVVAKVDRAVVEPEDQDEEHDLNKFLHSFAPEQIPETIETKFIEKDGKKVSLTYTRKVDLAPHGTEAAPGKRIKDLKKRFDAVGLHRFLDSNIGNGVEDERTGTNHSHEVDAKTGSEVYFDDSDALIISDVLQSRGNIERFVDANIGSLYTEEGAKKVKDTVDYIQNKYDPEYKKNPDYKSQKENQKKLITA
jgi:hypothetical protein